MAGSEQDISWASTGAVDSVQLDYSLDNGKTWTTIAAAANDGSEIWTIPLVESDSARVRVSHLRNPAVFDISDSLFKIIAEPSITVTAPNGGEVWYNGQRQTITWNSTGDFLEVRIEYSLDNGASWTVLRNDTDNDGRFNWIPQNLHSDSMLVRISDTFNPLIADVSDSVFTIRSRSVTLIAPNGGETWESGSTQTIAWEFDGPIDSVALEFSLNNGRNWEKMAAVRNSRNNSRYDWQLPEVASDSVLVRISDVSDSAVADVSDAVFRIVRTTLTLTAPNGGEIWMAGSQQSITWISDGGIDSVKIEYTLNHGQVWNAIAASAPNTGSYLWTLPETESTAALIYISDAADNSPSDISDGVFTIAAETLTLLSPNGGETWESGHFYDIEWSGSETISQVKLEYSLDNGRTWNTIADSLPNNDGYSWLTPAINSDSVLVRISDTSDGSPFDVSDEVFSITIVDGVVETDSGIPEHFELSQNYPNPFNIETKLIFAVPKASHVRLSVYNTKGELVRTIHAGELGPGRYTAVWDGRNDAGQIVASGAYVYRVQIGHWQAARKMSLIK